ncbi:MAG TPA: hypothetical protein VEU62_09195, partial [Bryobacterales bacterium]|nr:hypothetical protein [Bryobacterales bacterium]
IRKGIAAVAQPARRVVLEAWLETELRPRFADRLLAVDEAVADRWGIITGRAQSQKAAIPVIDGLLAATALHHNLILVTRHAQDVARTSVPVFNPWETRHR